MKIYIYKLINPRTQAVKYIGKTKNLKARLKDHCTRKRRAEWIKQLMNDGQRPVMELIEQVDGNCWHEREQYWIAYYTAYGEILENIATWPVPGSIGHTVSELTKERWRRAFTGRTIPPEVRARISKATIGKKKSPEIIAKRLATFRANWGKPPFDQSVWRKQWLLKNPHYQRDWKRKHGAVDRSSPEWKRKIAETLKKRYASLSPEEKEKQCQYAKMASRVRTPEMCQRHSVIMKEAYRRKRAAQLADQEILPIVLTEI